MLLKKCFCTTQRIVLTFRALFSIHPHFNFFFDLKGLTKSTISVTKLYNYFFDNISKKRFILSENLIKMKLNIKKIVLFVFSISILISCGNDDTSVIDENTFGDAQLYFDNGVNGDKLILNTAYANSNSERLTINRLNYIISNIIFIKSDGTEYVYPKNKSYSIVSEESGINTINLSDIPAGDYKQIKFGLGVDNQRYLEGETAQQEFWDYATSLDMVWTWSTGYRFINFEGTFTSESNPEAIDFQVHQGSNSATDNYREITLNLPTTARGRMGDKPNIHIIADANVILDGINKIKLGDNINQAGTSAAIMGGENLVKIAANTQAMFKVDHVHNGSGTEH